MATMEDPSWPQRKQPIHLAAICRDDRPVILFVTVNSHDRRPILANDAAVATVVEAWRQARLWKVGRYVFMPDHIHLFATPAWPDAPIARWVAFWKSVASRRWPKPDQDPVWQRDFWDRQLRSTESYDAHWEYVASNPVRAGLVANASEWPFKGEMNVLEWR